MHMDVLDEISSATARFRGINHRSRPSHAAEWRRGRAEVETPGLTAFQATAFLRVLNR